MGAASAADFSRGAFDRLTRRRLIASAERGRRRTWSVEQRDGKFDRDFGSQDGRSFESFAVPR